MKRITVLTRLAYFGLREPVSALTHILGSILSIIAFIVIFPIVDHKHSNLYTFTFSLYAVSQIALYSTSALYHSVNHSKEMVALLLKYDKAMIFFLIMGTYAPVCLVMLGGLWGKALFGINMVLCFFGIYLTLFAKEESNQVKYFCQSLYIICGWLIFVGWAPLIKNVDNVVSFYIFWGGVIYTIGAVIMEDKHIKIIPKYFESHELWHLIVMLGSSCHFYAIYKFLTGS